jgi:molybdopterin-binding protein
MAIPSAPMMLGTRHSARGSAKRLGLRVGDAVLAVIKSTEIMIGKESSR